MFLLRFALGHVLHPNEFTRNHEHLTRAKTVEVKDFREVDLPIIKLLFEEEKPLLEQVRDFIVSRDWGKRYELIFSSDHLLELTRRGATKGGMILKLAKLLGVARKDIYCIGDHNNDIPMLAVSEIGFAPENAISEVKEWGAHIDTGYIFITAENQDSWQTDIEAAAMEMIASIESDILKAPEA